ncbi:hypothetical protein NQ318_001819 [Aromia moschata]|uniref:Uncharacterized protein n=1 Tax=Aromia moschata TaxID=1265417 RepID=A0AAV8Z196_9CUCU|nr:hypothetical protein NQ318_001819 [Aromia moschata]
MGNLNSFLGTSRLKHQGFFCDSYSLDMAVAGGAALCRLCLERCTESKPLEGFVSYKLKFIIPVMDLDLSWEPRICGRCCMRLSIHYAFKSECMENNEPTRNFMELELLAKKRDALSVLLRNEEKRRQCGLCHTKKNVLGQSRGSQGQLLRTMLEKCLPDLDSRVTTMCGSCMDSLEHLFEFVNGCMSTEEKIKSYCYLKGLNGKSKISLHSVLKFHSFKLDEEEEYEATHDGEGVMTDATACDGFDDDRVIEEDNVVDIETVEEHKYHDIEEDEEEETISIEEIRAGASLNISELSQTVENTADLPDTNDVDGEIISIEEIEANASRSASDSNLIVNEGIDDVGSDEMNAFCDLEDNVPYEVSIKSETVYDEPELVDIDEVNMYTNAEIEENVEERPVKREVNVDIEEGPDRYHFEEYTKLLQQNSGNVKGKAIAQYKKGSRCRPKAHRKRIFERHSDVNLKSFKKSKRGNKIRNVDLIAKNNCNPVVHQQKYRKKPSFKDTKQMKEKTSTEESNSASVYSEDDTKDHDKDPEGFYCDLCSFWTKKEGYLERHMALQHNRSTEVRKYKCGICKYKTDLKAQLYYHLQNSHHMSLLKPTA